MVQQHDCKRVSKIGAPGETHAMLMTNDNAAGILIPIILVFHVQGFLFAVLSTAMD
jgi:hypothetical protein